jgi:hypothetical protein
MGGREKAKGKRQKAEGGEEGEGQEGLFRPPSF